MRLGTTALVWATALAGSAPLTAQSARSAAPTQADAVRFARDLDDLFNSRDRAGYFARFETSNRPCFEAGMRHRIESLSILGIRANSTVTEFAARGDVGVALVTTNYRHKQSSLPISTFTVIKRCENKTVGLFSVEVDAARAADLEKNSELFSCPACNYEVRFSKDWLAVPVLPSRSGCMEALWLVSLKHDIYMEAAVHVGTTAIEAPKALADCLQTTRARHRIQDRSAPAFTSWRPTAFAKDGMPTGMTGARCVRHGEQNMVAEMNLIAMGRLRYLIVVCGAQAAIDRQRGDIDAILKSFRLLQPSLTAKAMAARSTFDHTGAGTFDPANTYTNKKYGIALTGPQGWTADVRPGGWLFQVIFSCTHSDARLCVRAIRPIVTKWTRSGANRVVRNSLANTSRRKLSDTKWQKATTPDGFVWREFRMTRPGGEASDHVVRYAMRPDILLIMSGNLPTADAAADESIRRAMDSLATVK